MSDYKSIVGYKVVTKSSNPNIIEGEVWYNTTDDEVLLVANGFNGAWTAGADMNSFKWAAGSAGVTRDASLYFGGRNPAATGGTQSYNGTSWSEVNDLNQGRFDGGGGGTQTDAIYATGSLVSSPGTDPTAFPGPGASETWNGTSWTSGPTVGTARTDTAGNGTSTAGIIMGGALFPSGSNNSANTETYNGSAWTEVSDMNQSRYNFGVAGGSSNTALIIHGGRYESASAWSNPGPGIDYNRVTESWNGTSWTTLASSNVAKSGNTGTFGTSTAAIDVPSGPTTNTFNQTVESWNGTSWSFVSPLPIASNASGGSGTQTTGYFFGGFNSATALTTYDWDATTSLYNREIDLL